MPDVRSKTSIICLILAVAAAGVLVLEAMGVPTGLSIRTRGDVTRETQWLAQFGQFSCVTCVLIAIWLLDPAKRSMIPFVLVTVLLAAGAATVLKTTTGRVRPKYEGAGQFQGPFASHSSSHRSFPSGHTTSAFAFAGALAVLYPRGRGLVYTLAGITGALRWFMDAHWLSDVLAGAALGLSIVMLVRWLALMRGSLSIEPWLRPRGVRLGQGHP